MTLLTILRYGRYSTVAEADFGLVVASNSRACVYDAASDNMWVVLGGFVGGKSGASAPAVRIRVYDTDASKNQRNRCGYMAPVNATAVMAAGGDPGGHYTAAVSGSDNGPTNDAIMLFSGTRYAIDLLAGTNGLGHSMIEAALITADNELFYNRTAPSNPPPSAYGAYSSATEGHLTAYLQGYRNEAPLAPSNGLAPTGTVTESAPTFTADFDDLNGAYGTSSGDGLDIGDRINQYKVQLRAVGTTSLLWNQTYTATNAERTADAISRAYGGSALTRGTAYEWRVRMSDEFGTFGDYSAWTSFTPASLGFVTLDSDPTGKIESNQPDFKGRWNHQSATTMKTTWVRLLAANGATVLQAGADYNIVDVASSALPGMLFTIPWANTGLTDLSWGTSYTYQIKGYDGTAWSDWSAARSFATNAAPTVPTGLAPSSSQIFTSYPLLTCSFTDSDDTTATGLTGVFRITRPDTSTVDCTPTYNATTGKWEFQTTITEISAYGVYNWKATGYDGTLYSGEVAALGSAVWSTSATFDYEAGPVLAVSSPADGATVATASLTVSWSVSSGGPQVKYQVWVYADGDTGTTIYDSGLTTSTAVNHVIPSGYLRNSTSYDVVVAVTNSTPLTGYSATTNIAVAFTAPTAVANFQVTPVKIGLDPFETAVRLSWDQTAYSSPEFQEYTLYRSADGGPDADEIILARITAPGEIAFVDYTPASDYEYTYSITVTTLTGADSLESDRSEDTTSVTLAGTVLSLVGNGGTYRACLLNVRERSFDRQINEAVYQSLAETKPRTVRSVTRFWNGTYEGAAVSDDTATGMQRWNELDALDATHGTICIRDSRQRKRFCKIGNLKATDEHTDWVSFTFDAREEVMTEGTT